MTLQRPRFTTTMWIEGYDMAEVDSAIDRILAALADPVPQVAAADVSNLRFTPVRLRKSYTVGEVDQWLDEAAAELAQRADGAAPASASATASAPAPAPASESTTASPLSAYAPTVSDAIVEVDGRRSGAGLMLVLVVLVALIVAAYVYYA